MAKRLLRFAALACCFVLPWVLALGSEFAFERWLPGQVKASHWQNASSLLFLACGSMAVYLIWKWDTARWRRLTVASAAFAGALYLASAFQVDTRCDASGYMAPPDRYTRCK